MAEQNPQETEQAEHARRPITPERRHERHESRTGSTYKKFLKELMAIGSFSEEDAEEAAVSVLCGLSQRIMPKEASDLAAQLPLKLRELLTSCLRHEGKPRRFGKEEFFELVADDLQKDPAEVEPIVRAVFAAVRAQVSEGEAGDVAGQLPADLAELWCCPM